MVVVVIALVADREVDLTRLSSERGISEPRLPCGLIANQGPPKKRWLLIFFQHGGVPLLAIHQTFLSVGMGHENKIQSGVSRPTNPLELFARTHHQRMITVCEDIVHM